MGGEINRTILLFTGIIRALKFYKTSMLINLSITSALSIYDKQIILSGREHS